MPSDVVFADPPYDLPAEKYEELVRAVLSNSLLSDEGLLVVEHPGTVDLSQIDGFSQMRHYGTVHFSFFEKP